MKKIKAMFQLHGSGNISVRERSVSSFLKLHLCFRGNVTLVQSDDEKVVVECDDNLQDHIRVVNSGRTLYLVEESGVKQLLFTKIHVTVHLRNIDTLRNSMQGNVDSAGPIRCASTFELVVESQGDTKLELQAGALKATLRGQGDVTLLGESVSTTIKTMQQGNLFARGLKASTLALKNLSSGNVEVFATEQISIRHLGHGHVHYYGPAVLKDVNMMGHGEVRHMNG